MSPVRAPTSSIAIRRGLVTLLLVIASMSLAACAGGTGELQFGGQPFWKPPAHISDDRPN
jgi:predicted small secreted protein